MIQINIKDIFANNVIQKLFVGIVLLLPIIFYVARAYFMLDPDFGWHLKMGEYIHLHGIPPTDPFSYTMPSFPFVDHEWGTNVVFFFLFTHFGLIALVLVYTFLAFLSFYVAFSIQKRSAETFFSFKYGFLFLLVTATILPYFGIRPQVESWLLLSILLYILFKENVWQKGKYFLPLLFLIWGNIHGSFGAGIIILGFVLFLRTVRTRRISWNSIYIGIVSFLATFANPYGWNAWREVLQQATDSSIHWTISEWRSSLLSFNAPFLLLVCISILLIWKYRKQFLLEEKGLFIVMLYEAISATRHVPLWVLCALPFVLKGFTFLDSEVKKISYGSQRLKTLFVYSFLFSCLLFVVQSFFSVSSGAQLNDNEFYPKKAITYLSEHPSSGQLFSEYGWGGYLIWQLPEKKTFVDGRMATWKWNNNPPNEEGYVFELHQHVVSGEVPYKPTFEKYNIQTVLWPNPGNEEKNPLDERIGKLENILRSILKQKEYKPLIPQLEADGWQKVYEDEVSVIYQKP